MQLSHDVVVNNIFPFLEMPLNRWIFYDFEPIENDFEELEEPYKTKSDPTQKRNIQTSIMKIMFGVFKDDPNRIIHTLYRHVNLDRQRCFRSEVALYREIKFQNLETLQLGHTMSINQFVQVLITNPRLRQLSVNIDANKLRTIAYPPCPHLRRLTITAKSTFQDDTKRLPDVLKYCPNLEELRLSFCVDPYGYPLIKSLTKLKRLVCMLQSWATDEEETQAIELFSLPLDYCVIINMMVFTQDITQVLLQNKSLKFLHIPEVEDYSVTQLVQDTNVDKILCSSLIDYPRRTSAKKLTFVHDCNHAETYSPENVIQLETLALECECKSSPFLENIDATYLRHLTLNTYQSAFSLFKSLESLSLEARSLDCQLFHDYLQDENVKLAQLTLTSIRDHDNVSKVINSILSSPSNKTLRILLLESSHLEDDHFIQLVSNNCSIQVLGVCDSDVTDGGLLRGFLENDTIERLDVSSCSNVSGRFALKLGEYNTRLEAIDLQGCPRLDMETKYELLACERYSELLFTAEAQRESFMAM